MAKKDRSTGNEPPSKALLFVGPDNIQDVVERIAPGMLLVDRAAFIRAACNLEAMVNAAAQEMARAERETQHTPHSVDVDCGELAAVGEAMMQAIESATTTKSPPAPLQELAPAPVKPVRLLPHVVDGDYMRPTLEPGDMVEVDASVRRFEQEGIYLIDFGDKAPRLQRLCSIGADKVSMASDYLRSLGHKPEILSRRHLDQRIIGRAVNAAHHFRL